MNKLTEYIPGMSINGPIVERIVATFEESDDLKSISFVRNRIDIKGFHRLSISRDREPFTLMVEYDRGKTWFVLGFLENDIKDLPEWKAK